MSLFTYTHIHRDTCLPMFLYTFFLLPFYKPTWTFIDLLFIFFLLTIAPSWSSLAWLTSSSRGLCLLGNTLSLLLLLQFFLNLVPVLMNAAAWKGFESPAQRPHEPTRILLTAWATSRRRLHGQMPTRRWCVRVSVYIRMFVCVCLCLSVWVCECLSVRDRIIQRAL